MTSAVSFTAVYETVENGWTQAHLSELPGVITAAPTRDGATELLVDALREYLLALQTPSAEATTHPANVGTLEVTIRAA
jgi:predicted RNase H-like HicB family nuclease